MSHTHWVFSILLVKKITTDFDLCLTPRPTSSWSVSRSHRLLHLKTYGKSGSLRYITTALVYLA